MRGSAISALAAVALLCAAAPLAAQSDGDSAAAAAGKRLFDGKGLCFSCHGKDGEGALGPSTRLAGITPTHVKPVLADVIRLIKEGVDSAHSSISQVMPPRGGSRLTDAEVESVARYVLELFQAKRSEGPSGQGRQLSDPSRGTR